MQVQLMQVMGPNGGRIGCQDSPLANLRPFSLQATEIGERNDDDISCCVSKEGMPVVPWRPSSVPSSVSARQE